MHTENAISPFYGPLPVETFEALRVCFPLPFSYKNHIDEELKSANSQTHRTSSMNAQSILDIQQIHIIRAFLTWFSRAVDAGGWIAVQN